VLVVDGAANRVSSSQKLTADTAQILSHGSVFHDPGSAEYIVPGDVTVVRDVLDLLSVTWWLLEGLDEQCRGTRHDGHGSLSILNGQLHGHFEALVLFGVLADVITNFFRGETERSNFWRKRGGGSDLASDSSEAHSGDGGGVEFWWHFRTSLTGGGVKSVSST